MHLRFSLVYSVGLILISSVIGPPNVSITDHFARAQNVSTQEPKAIIPNDQFFKNQFSFYHPGGKITIDTESYKPSAKEFVISSGVTLDVTHA